MNASDSYKQANSLLVQIPFKDTKHLDQTKFYAEEITLVEVNIKLLFL